MKIIFFIFLISFIFAKEFNVKPTKFKTYYADWAHKHWIWLHRESQSQAALLELYNTYTELNIPVGAINIDSRWSTGVNNFIWNTTKFPNIKQFVDFLHTKNVNTICWVTSLINEDSSNFRVKNF
jgi:alpha-glucosidase (family GH31 glycosyl hydrolase)